MMKKLYEKSEIWFAVVWIIAYCVFVSIGDNLSSSIGILKVVTLPILIVLSVVLYFFVKNNRLLEKYGLCKTQIFSSKTLFYIPLIVLLTANLWHGVRLNTSPIEAILYILSMLCVGFLEEMIFRGFLFKAMAKSDVKSAIIVSSITFGVGHIVNLVNGSGSELLPTILQIISAIAIGFAFVMIFYKSKSLLPCIVTHGLFNSLSIFANEMAITEKTRIFTCLSLTLIAGLYALYFALMVKDKEQNCEDVE